MLLNNNAEINYPCEWIYKIIGTDPGRMQEAIGTIIQPETYTISESRTSRSSKYVSLTIELVVFSEKERTNYYNRLGQHEDIKMVL